MSYARFKALSLMALVFLLGAVVGASLGTTFISNRFASTPKISSSQGRQKTLDKFKSRLGLSPEQTDRLQIILEETRKEFSNLHQSVKPQYDEIRHRMRTQIREILNDDQKKEFEVMNREYDERRARGRSR